MPNTNQQKPQSQSNQGSSSQAQQKPQADKSRDQQRSSLNERNERPQ